MDVEAQSPLPTGGHKVLSKEEWLKFKPIIQQLYIDENQTFPTVARELARRFDFYPTKRQFTRKTEEWGLKKNFRKAERRLLLQNDKKSGTAQSVIGDKRVSDPKRIQRLKRRYAHESPLSQDLSYPDTNIPPKFVGPFCSPEEQLPISNYVDKIASARIKSTSSTITEENDAMDLEQWPFSRDIDVPGSPGLTRLFRLLEIEASMPPLNLDDEVVNKKGTISGNELRNNVESHGTTSRQLSTLCSRVKYGYIPNTVVQPVPISGKRIPWSPLFELDLFPTSRSTRGNGCGMTIASVSSPSIDVWKKEIEEWKLKLRKFRKTLPDHNPAIILSLEHLIYLYKQRKENCLLIQNLLNNQNLDRSHKMTSDALMLLAFLIEEKDEDSYSEIEKLYRYNIHQVSKHGQSLGNTYFDSMSHLIYVLLEGQKIEEAHSLCIYIMEYVELGLGYCYEQLSQFQDALFLYRNLLRKVKSVTGDDNPFIKEFEGYIPEVQERMEESSASNEDDGSRDTDSSRGVQMGEVDDNLGFKIIS
ncbi:hypothetical protein BCON_0020g00440 [Botryotinia convoluta]|uniref:Clr5 domain-containing protein n=1 Tax=Botryotinia convoluta TaxID=54673 RepID=A0A4Z1IL69_9HELO|nr:hypothetical protein BCON_0020g00440 [Botryotinia convoluta]